MKQEKKFTMETSLGTYGCDRSRIAKLSGLLQITQDAGQKDMVRSRPSYEELQEKGQALMLSRLDLAVYDVLRYEEPVTVSTWACPSARATFPRMYFVERDGKTIVEVASQWALVEMETRKILKSDDADFSNFYMSDYHDLFPGKFKISRDLQLEEVGRRRVNYSDLDYNGHMNNTYYADVLCDHVPELEAGTHRVSALRIHYSKEAPLGDVLTITRACPREGDYVFRTIKESGEVNIEAEIMLTAL